MAMRYEFLVDTYSTERVKVLSVWSMFQDGDLPVRPHPTDPRGRSVLEQMVHQCCERGPVVSPSVVMRAPFDAGHRSGPL